MPQRFLRPGIRTSERWNRVSFKAQSLYVRLLTLVDDFGRYDGRPSVLHGECWSVWNEHHPEDVVNPQETAALCCELQREKLAFFYEKDGKKCLQLIQWQERARAEKSKWPDPPQETAAESCGILPPSPSPSPLHPRSSPPPCGGGVELPLRFPKTEQEAFDQSFQTGASREFVSKTWDKAMSRGGKDSNEKPILSWTHHVSAEMKYERERIHNGKQSNGSVSLWQQKQSLEAVILNHKANRESLKYDKNCTQALRDELRKYRSDLEDVIIKMANGGK